jgi:uncharacterized integral membrane protein
MNIFKRIIYLLLIILLLTGIIGIIISNPDQVTLEFFGKTTPSLPIYIIVLVSFLAGVIFVTILNIISVIKSELTISKQKKKIKELEQKLASINREPNSETNITF